jgi:hypothetical protein
MFAASQLGFNRWIVNICAKRELARGESAA